MRTILVLGAGRSATVLLDQLVARASEDDWMIEVGDLSVDHLNATYGGSDRIRPFLFTLEQEEVRRERIAGADLVISMLPAHLHPVVARDCLNLGKDLLTPSYQSAEMDELADDARQAGLLFLNELGVDPGIDHMSAMRIIDDLHARGATITAFESFTGGLVAPESDDNPWHYKFTWNPWNVIRAGAGGTVKFLHNGRPKYIPYHKLFDRTELIDIEGYGTFQGYANRDSLVYKDLYGLHDVRTLYRGTLRRPPFCTAWHMLVQIGATDDGFIMDGTETMTYRQFINSFLKYRDGDSVELKLAYYLGKDVDSEEMRLLEWAGLFSDEVIGLRRATPARVLEHLFKQRWAMGPDDRDMIVMWHLFEYELDGRSHRLESSMVAIGEDTRRTAMARTVGLPLAIAARERLTGGLTLNGVHRPLMKEVYDPVLDQLETTGIAFREREQAL